MFDLIGRACQIIRSLRTARTLRAAATRRSYEPGSAAICGPRIPTFTVKMTSGETSFQGTRLPPVWPLGHGLSACRGASTARLRVRIIVSRASSGVLLFEQPLRVGRARGHPA